MKRFLFLLLVASVSMSAFAEVHKGPKSETTVTNAGLPEFVAFRAYLGGARGQYRVEIEGDEPLNRNGFSGWCLDKDAEVRAGQTYQAMVITDWSALHGVVNYPEEIYLVDYIVRQNLVGRSLVLGKIVKRHHVQRVIWFLLDDKSIRLDDVERRIIRNARNTGRFDKRKPVTCWGTHTLFILVPLYVAHSGAVSPDYDVQPMLVDLRGEIVCPPKVTPTPTATPSSTRTPSPTPSATPTFTVTPSFTPSPTPTPTCPSPTPTPTCTPQRGHKEHLE